MNGESLTRGVTYLLVTPCRHLHLAALNFWLLKKGPSSFTQLLVVIGDAAGCTGHLEVITEMQLIVSDC